MSKVVPLRTFTQSEYKTSLSTDSELPNVEDAEEKGAKTVRPSSSGIDVWGWRTWSEFEDISLVSVSLKRFVDSELMCDCPLKTSREDVRVILSISAVSEPIIINYVILSVVKCIGLRSGA